jgi:8-oxo-dGTP pyrophosphatase MutT (NUDIX family)
MMPTKGKQAMAVCYTVNGSEIQFLLVKNKKGNRRTFPKGSIKKSEMPWLTAVREAFS